MKPRRSGLKWQEADARRTAIAKTLARINRAWPYYHPPYNPPGLAIQQAVAENA